MRWQLGRRSTNVEDRRGFGVGSGTAMGGGVLLLITVAAAFLGVALISPLMILAAATPAAAALGVSPPLSFPGIFRSPPRLPRRRLVQQKWT